MTKKDCFLLCFAKNHEVINYVSADVAIWQNLGVMGRILNGAGYLKLDRYRKNALN
jgi:hypothetical protein